jgi:hypothetical protein
MGGVLAGQATFAVGLGVVLKRLAAVTLLDPGP